MIRKKCEEYLQKLQAELHEVEISNPTPIQSLKSYLSLVTSSLEKIKEIVLKSGFDSDQEEIYFFKYIKPSFYSLLIYQLELFNLESNKPSLDQKKLRAYYVKEMEFVERFFRQHSFHYEYYRLDASDLDNLYFIRGEKMNSILTPQIPEPNSDFSTCCDHLFSKFIGMEMLRDTLSKMIDDLSASPDTIGEPVMEMKWTGDKVNLAEIIYGIYFTGQLNHGKTELSTMIKWLGKIFSNRFETHI